LPLLRFAKILMTALLGFGSGLSFVLDWSPNHLLNPLRTSHARFHGALLFFFLAGISLTGIWHLWRKSSEPEVGFKIGLLIAISYWTPLFFIPLLLPSSTWWAGSPGGAPHVAGIVFFPNLGVASLFLIAAIIAYQMARGALRIDAGSHGNPCHVNSSQNDSPCEPDRASAG
jgi:hypothetical protein